MIKTTLLAICVLTCTSCFKNYYSVKSISTWDKDILKETTGAQKTLYIHFPDAVREMTNAMVKDSSISGDLKLPDNVPAKYLHPTDAKFNKYKIRDRHMLFSQVHVYVKDSFPHTPSFVVPTHTIDFIEVYKPNKGASVGSHFLGAGLILVSIAGIIVLGMTTTEGMLFW